VGAQFGHRQCPGDADQARTRDSFSGPSISHEREPRQLGSCAQNGHRAWLTELPNETEAVAKATRGFLRLTTLRELKAVSGKVDYCDVSDELEALELRELRREPV